MLEIDNTLIHSDVAYDYSSFHDIANLKSTDLKYNDFFKNYMLPNIPCIIKGITQHWNSSQLWLNENEPNFEYLNETYGRCSVTVHNCSERYYNCQKSYETTVADYLTYFQEFNSQTNTPAKLQYLKNWHLKLDNEGDNFYEVPIFFASDWLNEYYTNCLHDDYRFVYMGPRGTWTPFHADVFMSYSWSANVCGKKKWLIFPPGEEDYLKDKLGNLPYDIVSEDHSRKYFEVIQGPGDAIFIPSGWHHQVWNLENTISINHNWVNGCNIKTMYDSMILHLRSVQKEIEDCKEMANFEEHCQLMLNASFGIDFYRFYEFLKFIAPARIDMIREISSKTLFHGHEIGPNHILFDLKSVENILKLFVELEEVNSLEYFTNVEVKPLKLLNELKLILDNIQSSDCRAV